MPSNDNLNRISTVVSSYVYNKIIKLSSNEVRTISQTTSILLEKAIDSLKKNKEYSYLFIDDNVNN